MTEAEKNRLYIVAAICVILLIIGAMACCMVVGPIDKFIAPTPTKTRMSTPVPMPTIAPMPTATPTPDAAILETRYRAGALSVMLKVHNHAVALGDLLGTIDFRDPNWAAAVRGQVAGMRGCREAWEQLEPSPNLAAYHEMVRAGFEDVCAAMDLIEEFVDTGNEDSLSEASWFISLALAKWEIAGTMVPEGWWGE